MRKFKHWDIASSLAIAGLWAGLTLPAAAQPAPSQNPGGMTDAQVLNAARNLVNNTPSGLTIGGYNILPSPADIAQGLNNLGFGNQAAVTNNPNANLGRGSTTAQAGSTDFGATALGMGAPLVNNSNQLGGILNELEGGAGSQQFQQRQQQIRADYAANNPTGPGFWTVDLGTGQRTWHTLPSQPVDYSAMDAYLADYMANRGQTQIRDPFQQPTTQTQTQNAAQTTTYQPQLPSGPSYPTARPRQSTTTSQADLNAAAAALGSALGVGMAEALRGAFGDAAASASGAAGIAGETAADPAFEAAGAAIGATMRAALDAGCQTGQCNVQGPYDPRNWQPMPTFTVRPSGPGGITDSSNATMTRVAELLPIYEGYDPFASGRLVQWPASTIFPTLYPPTGMSSAGLGGYSLADPFFMTPQTLSDAYDLLYPGSSRFRFPLDPAIGGGAYQQVGGRYSGLVSQAGWMINRQSMPGWEFWNLPWSSVFGSGNMSRSQQDILMAALNPMVSNILFRYSGQGALTLGGGLVGNLLGLSEADLLRMTTASDVNGLTTLLSQPFNVLLVWGPGAYDLDLHMTGPSADGSRFHIYYANRGSQIAPPYAELIRDCVCTSGSEVILTAQLERGGVYRVSVFNYGSQSSTSTNLSSSSNAIISIVRGGVAVGVGQGTTIQGGREIFTRPVPGGGLPGNTWSAVEINPANGRIYDISSITSFSGSGSVQ